MQISPTPKPYNLITPKPQKTMKELKYEEAL